MSQGGTEKLQSPLNNVKQPEGTCTTVPKKRCILSRRPHLDIKQVKILTESDVPEEIKIGIETGFEVKFVEHKE